MNELEEVLLRREAPQDLLAERLFPEGFGELLHDRQRHVGLEQRHPDLAERLGHVAFRDPAVAAQALEDLLELVAQCVEHTMNESA